MRDSGKTYLFVMAVVVVLGIHVSRAAADGLLVIINSTDKNAVKVNVTQDGRALKNLTLPKDGAGASFELKGGKTLTLKISGAPHNGSVTVDIPSGSDYHMLLLQITENGFVNVGASKAGKALKIK